MDKRIDLISCPLNTELGGTISLFWITPFACLLLSIALLPLLCPHFWEKNRNKAIIAALFGIPAAIFIGIQDIGELQYTLREYFSFVTLLASLFIISGGIHLKGDLKAKPITNTLFLLIGSILSNFIGTTGASILLIRPLLRTNQEREKTKHIPIFFIFLVCNIGGLLLPVGDPPLFLGFLEGVPFFWTLKLFPIWLFETAVLLLTFYLIDTVAYGKETASALSRDRAAYEPLSIEGTINFLWLGGVLTAAIFLRAPLREMAMWAMALSSWFTTSQATRNNNRFTFYPIVEVAILFAGIFAAMIPSLLILKTRGAALGIKEPWQFFWASGMLSSFLDNAPTYLVNLSLAQDVTKTLGLVPDITTRGGGVSEIYLKAISAGSVFMGANTYIGNAPNFMIKSISDEWKFKTPGFLGYMLWSGIILIPTFILATALFF